MLTVGEFVASVALTLRFDGVAVLLELAGLTRVVNLLEGDSGLANEYIESFALVLRLPREDSSGLLLSDEAGRDLDSVGLDGPKKPDRRLEVPGVGGSPASVSMVLSERDGRGFRALGVAAKLKSARSSSADWVCSIEATCSFGASLLNGTEATSSCER